MDELPSAQFRKRYARLTEPTIVTVNGHALGHWIPASKVLLPETGPIPADDFVRAVRPGLTQAQRDDLLRKINRGAKP